MIPIIFLSASSEIDEFIKDQKRKTAETKIFIAEVRGTIERSKLITQRPLVGSTENNFSPEISRVANFVSLQSDSGPTHRFVNATFPNATIEGKVSDNPEYKDYLKVWIDGKPYVFKPVPKSAIEAVEAIQKRVCGNTSFKTKSAWNIKLIFPINWYSSESCYMHQIPFVEGEAFVNIKSAEKPNLMAEAAGTIHNAFMDQDHNTVILGDTHQGNFMLDGKTINVIDWDLSKINKNIEADVLIIFEKGFFRDFDRRSNIEGLPSFEWVENEISEWLSVIDSYLSCFEDSKHNAIKHRLKTKVPVEPSDIARMVSRFYQLLTNFIVLENNMHMINEKYANFKTCSQLLTDQQERLWGYVGLSYLTQEQRDKILSAPIDKKDRDFTKMTKEEVLNLIESLN